MTKIVARGDPIEPVYLNSLGVAAHGWGVVSGLTVAQRAAGANMSVDVASGEAWINGTKITKGSTTNVVITAAHATYDRYDLVVINSSGTISVIAGTAAATSYANDYDLESANAILLAEVEVPATDTTIETAQCTDKRIMSFIEETDVANGIPRLDSSADIPMTQLKTNVANGVAGLDASADVPMAQLKVDVVNGLAGLDGSSEIPMSLLKSDAVSGVPELDAAGNVLSVGSDIFLTRVGDDIHIRERTSNEYAFELRRNSANNFSLRVFESAVWVDVNPPGIISMFHGLISAIPTGWVLCDGSNGTPDLRSKFIRGAPAATEAGGTGGSDTHTLTTSEMPAHTHGSNLVRNGSAQLGGTSLYKHDVGNTDSAGGGSAHNNMPAYYQILFIMKT